MFLNQKQSFEKNNHLFLWSMLVQQKGYVNIQKLHLKNGVNVLQKVVGRKRLV